MYKREYCRHRGKCSHIETIIINIRRDFIDFDSHANCRFFHMREDFNNRITDDEWHFYSKNIKEYWNSKYDIFESLDNFSRRNPNLVEPFLSFLYIMEDERTRIEREHKKVITFYKERLNIEYKNYKFVSFMNRLAGARSVLLQTQHQLFYELDKFMYDGNPTIFTLSLNDYIESRKQENYLLTSFQACSYFGIPFSVRNHEQMENYESLCLKYFCYDFNMIIEDYLTRKYMNIIRHSEYEFIGGLTEIRILQQNNLIKVHELERQRFEREASEEIFRQRDKELQLRIPFVQEFISFTTPTGCSLCFDEVTHGFKCAAIICLSCGIGIFERILNERYPCYPLLNNEIGFECPCADHRHSLLEFFKNIPMACKDSWYSQFHKICINKVALFSILDKEWNEKYNKTFLIETLVTELTEKYVNKYCPVCKTVFIDWDGCMALNCSNPSCSMFFCGMCLEYAGTSPDVHTHVARCIRKYTSSQVGEFTLSLEVAVRLQEKIRYDKLKIHLDTINLNIQQEVIKGLLSNMDQNSYIHTLLSEY